MAKLQEQVEYFSRKIEQENLKLNQINSQIQQLEHELEFKRAQQAEKSKKRDEDPVALTRKNKALQLKLDGIRQKRNNIEADNQRLKEAINQIRKERNLFNNVYDKLKKELDGKREDLKKVIAESNFAKGYIDQAHKELEEQQKLAFIEQRKFEKEFEIHPLKPKKTQILIQNSEKSKPSHSLGPRSQEPKSQGPFSPRLHMITQTTENPLQRVLSKQGFRDRKDKVKQDEKQLKDLQQKVQEYENVINDLMVQTKSKSFEEILGKFQECEEENYILFRNVNQLDDEYENLQNQKKKLILELEQLNNQPKENVVDRRAQQLQQIMRDIEEATSKRDLLKWRLDDQLDIWETLKTQIPVMYSKILKIYQNLCLENGEPELLSEELNINNVAKVMGKIENLTIAIIQTQRAQSSLKITEKRSLRLVEDSIPTSNSQQIQQLPSEELEKALYRLDEEFKNNIEKANDDRRSLRDGDFRETFFNYQDLRNSAEQDYKKLLLRRGTIKRTTQKQ